MSVSEVRRVDVGRVEEVETMRRFVVVRMYGEECVHGRREESVLWMAEMEASFAEGKARVLPSRVLTRMVMGDAMVSALFAMSLKDDFSVVYADVWRRGLWMWWE